jgi:hypothetical protein
VVRELTQSGDVCSLTFHVSLSFENDEGIASAATILVTDDSYTLDRSKTLKFTPEIAVGRVFWLEQYVCKDRIQKERKGYGKPDER